MGYDGRVEESTTPQRKAKRDRRILGGEFQGKRAKGLVDLDNAEFDKEWKKLENKQLQFCAKVMSDF